MATSTALYSASASVVVPTAGTYDVGLCVDPVGNTITMSSNAQGWVMVTNEP